MRKNQRQQKKEQIIPDKIQDLVLASQPGRPLAIYQLATLWSCFFFTVPRILLIIVIFLLLFRVIMEFILFFQFQISQNIVQKIHIQQGLLEGLLGIFIQLGVIGVLGVATRTMLRTIPRYWFVYSEGILCVFSKRMEMTRWTEITAIRKISKRHYIISRLDREPLSFGYPLQHFEELAGLVRQYIQMNDKNLQKDE